MNTMLSDLSMVDLAREFEELQSFAEKFGGESFLKTLDLHL